MYAVQSTSAVGVGTDVLGRDRVSFSDLLLPRLALSVAHQFIETPDGWDLTAAGLDAFDGVFPRVIRSWTPDFVRLCRTDRLAVCDFEAFNVVVLPRVIRSWTPVFVRLCRPDG
jgi:hypothetical protein